MGHHAVAPMPPGYPRSESTHRIPAIEHGGMIYGASGGMGGAGCERRVSVLPARPFSPVTCKNLGRLQRSCRAATQQALRVRVGSSAPSRRRRVGAWIGCKPDKNLKWCIWKASAQAAHLCRGLGREQDGVDTGRDWGAVWQPLTCLTWKPTPSSTSASADIRELGTVVLAIRDG